MKKNSLVFFWTALVCCLFCAALPLGSQEFGFGFSEEESAGLPDSSIQRERVSIGGALAFDMALFLDDDAVLEPLSAMADSRLSFSASGSSVDMLLKLRINERILSENPSDLVDEASLRLYLGRLDLEGGLLKAVWGKADSQGPLDVLNPQDLSDLSIRDEMDRKIAQPMLRASYALGSFSKLEAVYIPGFTPDRLAFSGPWMPARLRELEESAYSLLYPLYYENMKNTLYSTIWVQAYSALRLGGAEEEDANTAAVAAANAAVAAQAPLLASQTDEALRGVIDNAIVYPDSSGPAYSQGGLRFTGTLAALDFGLQYFTGFLPEPVFAVDLQNLSADNMQADLDFNRFHQFGLDAATVLGPYALRAEAALNLTEDLYGSDPLVYNPALLWSLGFDRILFSSLSINLQGSGSYRLYNDKTSKKPGDIEAGLDPSRTRFTALLSHKFLRDTVELELAGLYGLEDRDYLVMPAVVFSVGDAEIRASAGIFGGDKSGDLGQFRNNNYIKLGLQYTF